MNNKLYTTYLILIIAPLFFGCGGPVTGENKNNASASSISLSDKKPTVTEIKSEEGMFFGILEANDGSIWLSALDGVYRYDGNTITDFKSKEIRK